MLLNHESILLHTQKHTSTYTKACFQLYGSMLFAYLYA